MVTEEGGDTRGVETAEETLSEQKKTKEKKKRGRPIGEKCGTISPIRISQRVSKLGGEPKVKC